MPKSVNVPCNGCTKCCIGDSIFLHPEEGDDVSQYRTVKARNPFSGNMDYMLERNPDGSCVYLTANGCSIHGKAPLICRKFDCRRLAQLVLTNARAREANARGLVDREVLQEGIKRLSTLIRKR